MRIWTALVGVFCLVGLLAWLSDFITLQGERTIYTVGCEGGAWQGPVCNGHLVASDRHRFRALQVHGEVLFWTVRSKDASSKFTQCTIQGGRNWTCPPNADAGKTIILQLVNGRPVHDESGKVRSFHAVAKWRWLLLSNGFYAGDTADE